MVTNPGTGSPNRLLVHRDRHRPTPPPPPPGRLHRHATRTDVAIPDAGAAVTSSIAVTGCSAQRAGRAPRSRCDIMHTYRGDLVVDLVAPDGSAYRLKNRASGGLADNVNTTYTVNASSEAANGTWRLRVQDVCRGRHRLHRQLDPAVLI